MEYLDTLYGRINLPDFIGELTQTPEVQRLHDVSQDVLPQDCVPWRIPSRFEHCLGVCGLATIVLTHNHHALSEHQKTLLPIAALLHDAGNPALSHLSEPFLKAVTGKDGESFLEDVLDGSVAGAIVRKLGFSIREIVDFVTGNTKPLSTVLNGSLDIDNLDNVSRYWYTAHSGDIQFSASAIASSMRYHAGEWSLMRECFEESRRWQETRRAVYDLIYGVPHLNAAMMVWRAVSIAFERGEITEDFFRLTDAEAIDFLARCNEHSAHLIRRTRAREWYLELAAVETTKPSLVLKDSSFHWRYRTMAADYIQEQLHVRPEMVCVYVGQGRDKRRIDLPFIGENGSRVMDYGNHDPIYRIRVYVDPDVKTSGLGMESFVKAIFNLR